jgi:hypothetical protein
MATKPSSLQVSTVTQSRYIPRVPECMSTRWDFPTPSPASECVPEPKGVGGGGTFACYKGGREVPIPTKKSLPLWTVYRYNSSTVVKYTASWATRFRQTLFLFCFYFASSMLVKEGTTDHMQQSPRNSRRKKEQENMEITRIKINRLGYRFSLDF